MDEQTAERLNFLEESRDFWQQDAEFERGQSIFSFIIAGSGVLFSSVGAVEFFQDGNPAGFAGVVMGGLITAISFREGLKEVDSYAELRSRVAEIQLEIDQITE